MSGMMETKSLSNELY